MTTPIGGLVSGIDTDAQIKAILKPRRDRVDKEKQKVQILEWKRDSYRDTNSKLLTLRNAAADLKLPSVFKSKTVNSSDSSVLTATATANAENGTHTITVNSLLSGVTRISTSELDAYKDTLAAQFGISGTIAFKLKGSDGVENSYSFDTATKSINDVVNAINANASSSRINVGYSTEGNRFVMSTADKGVDAKIEVVADASGFLSTTLKLGLTTGVYSGTDASIDYDGATGITFKSNQFTLNDINFNLNKTGVVSVTISNNVDSAVAKIKAFIEAYNATIDNVNGKLHEKRILDTSKQIKYPPLTEDQKAEMTAEQITKWETQAQIGLMRSESLLQSTMSSVRMTATNMLSNKVDLRTTPVNLASTSGINPYSHSLASQFGIYGTVKFTLTGMDGVAKDYSFNSTSQNLADVRDAINANTATSGIKADYSGNGFSLSTVDSGPKGKMTVTDTTSFLGNQLKLNVTNGVTMFSTAKINSSIATLGDQFGIDVADTVDFTLTGKDGVANTYSFDSTQCINDIITAINLKTTATGIKAEFSSNGFSLSTVDSGSTATIKAMDTDSFLRNKLKLNVTDNVTYKGTQTANLTNTFKGTQTPALTDPMEDANYLKYKSLEAVGITTGSYLEKSNDNGKLYINEDQLRAALQDNPTDVMKLFTATQSVTTGGTTVTYNIGIAMTMYDTATKQITSLTQKAGMSGAAYDNSSLTQAIYEEGEIISRLNDRIDYYEIFYYKKFATMEKALQKANQQSEWITQKLSTTSS
ncbi:MAG: hypothetical protein CVU90_07025 [Firmicutes bacterium HGW-Firmicutes-15]|nr:MAG: hypothetical protein CVU90_07025 [Firmicutes bacterium HGW-Firmicutes-15]